MILYSSLQMQSMNMVIKRDITSTARASSCWLFVETIFYK